PPVAPGPFDGHTFEPVVDVHGGFGCSEEEVAVGGQEALDAPDDGPLGVDVEVDEDVAQEDDVEGGKGRPGADEVQRGELDHRHDLGLQLVVDADLAEVLDEQRCGQPPVDLQRLVQAGPAPVDHLPGEVGGGDGDVPAPQLGKGVVDGHGDRVRLLAGARRRAPDPQAALRRPGLDHRGQDGGPQRL